MRVAFVGQSTFFEVCSLENGVTGHETRFFEFRRDGDADGLVGALRDYRPEIVVAFRPDVLPAGLLAEIDALRLGFLTEPLPRTGSGDPVHEDLSRRLWELEQIDPSNVDRVVSFDPMIATTASRIVPVWRSVPLPVADRFYRPVGERPVAPPRPLFVGRSTPHREDVLMGAKHHYDLVHLAFGIGADDLEEAMAQHDTAVNVHNQPYRSFENRVCLHLAAGHLVLSEPLDPLHGLEPDIDFLEFEHAGQLMARLWNLERFPGLWHSVRVRGRRKAEQFRASRVWPRIFGDLAADCDQRQPSTCRPAAGTGGSARSGSPALEAMREFFSDSHLEHARVSGDEVSLFDATFHHDPETGEVTVTKVPDDEWLVEHVKSIPAKEAVWETVAFLKVRRLNDPAELIAKARSGELYDEDYFTKRGGGAPYVGYPFENTGSDDNEKRRHSASLAGEVIDRFAPERTLDLGCATGHLVKAFEERGVDAWGTDISDWAVANAVTDRVVKGSAYGLEWEDESFDVITSMDFMEHMHPDDLPGVLAEQLRVLRPDGRLLHYIPFYDADEPYQLDAHLCQASSAWWYRFLETIPGLEIARRSDERKRGGLDDFVELRKTPSGASS